MKHKLLQRQLKRLLGIGDDTQLTLALAELQQLAQRDALTPATRTSLTGLAAFLEQVNESYAQGERALELSTRSLELSSDELSQANESLRREAQSRELALNTLRDTTNQLLAPLGRHIGADDQSLGRLTDLLSTLVQDLMTAQHNAEIAYRKLQNQQFALDQHAIVSITDAQGRIIYANQLFCDISKFDRRDLIGKDHRLVNSGEHSQAFFREMWETITVGKVWHGEVRNRASDGSYYWVAATIVPFLDDAGLPYEYISMRTDISERKRAEEELRQSEVKQRMLIDNAADAVLVVAQDRMMVYVNELAAELLGYTREELVGLTVFDLLPPETAEHYFQVLREQLFDKGRIHVDAEFIHKDRHTIPVELNVAVLPDRNIYISCRDVTLRKEVEAALLRAKEEAEATNRAKSDFLATMSHEIRTPMNGIIGMTELTLETELDAEQREYLGLVKTSADALLIIINDILDFSKIESGKMVLEEVEFDHASLLATTTKLLSVKAEEKGLDLVYDVADEVPENLVGDPGRLRQILMNLIGNAIKFTNQGSISVTVRVVERSTHDVRLAYEVIDQGIGIPPEKQHSIFEAFTQADTSTTRKYGGTGLGLAICNQLVQAMGGKIGVRSELGKGSVFYFDARFAIGQQLQSTEVHSELRGISALLVDDNSTNLRLLAQMLKKWGMKPTTAHRAEQALQLVQAAHAMGEPFKLIVLDALMPGLDGFELAQRLRHLPECSNAAMVMLSSAGMRGDAQRCREVGIQAYLTKPIDQAEIFSAFKTVLNAAPDAVLITRHNLNETRPAKQLNILLAEDNPINQKLAVTLLAKWGHTVEVAHNGTQAVEKSAENVYDVILMDLQMPEMGGLEATVLIRDRERSSGQHIPIIAMTANAMSGDKQRCLAAGMDNYISKPLNIEQLRKVLTHHASPISAPAATPAVSSASTPVAAFDYERALSAADAWIVETIGQTFLDECPGQLQSLQAAIASQDRAQAKRLAHTLAGLLGNFQARPIVEMARQLEAASDTAAVTELSTYFENIMHEIDIMRPALRKHLAQLSAVP